jgi:hypothetical protein
MLRFQNIGTPASLPAGVFLVVAILRHSLSI